MQTNDYLGWRKKFFSLIASFMLLIITISCRGQNDVIDLTYISQMERNKSIIKNKFQQWADKKGNFFDLLDKNVEWIVAGRAPFSGIYYGKKNFMDQAVIPITKKLKTPIQPEFVSLTTEKDIVWLHWKGKAITITGESYQNQYAWMLTMKNDRIIKVTAFLDTYELFKLNKMEKNQTKTIEETKEYIGMWVTEDGYIRHELLLNNRYDEARGNRKSAYQGSYKVTGNHIDYKDDTGFTADGEFKDGILYHAGMVLYKE